MRCVEWYALRLHNSLHKSLNNVFSLTVSGVSTNIYHNSKCIDKGFYIETHREYTKCELLILCKEIFRKHEPIRCFLNTKPYNTRKNICPSTTRCVTLFRLKLSAFMSIYLTASNFNPFQSILYSGNRKVNATTLIDVTRIPAHFSWLIKYQNYNPKLMI